MFIYSRDGTTNVIVSLHDLESCVLLLTKPAAALEPEYRRWDDWSGMLARVMSTEGIIHVTVEPAGSRPPLRGWRGPLDGAPEPYRKDVKALLNFFACRHRQKTELATVELIGLDGNEKAGG